MTAASTHATVNARSTSTESRPRPMGGKKGEPKAETASQFGFDFADVAQPAYVELPVSGWLSPAHTTAEFLAIFERASLVVPSLTGAAAALFAHALQAAKAEHAKMLDVCDRGDEAYELWRVDVHADASLIDAFRVECIAGASAVPGIECKVRAERMLKVHGMYVPDLGSLVVHEYAEDNFGVDFYPWRDSFFMHSYRDDIRFVRVAEAVFADAYCADKIAESNEGIASVPVFMHEGREYINDGGMSKGNYRECGAWAFCAIADWNGPTYSYRTQCQAWNEGRTERGDRRGLLVRVRGQLAVLTGKSIFFDDAATGYSRPLCEEQESEEAEYDENDYAEEEEGAAA